MLLSELIVALYNEHLKHYQDDSDDRIAAKKQLLPCPVLFEKSEEVFELKLMIEVISQLFYRMHEESILNQTSTEQISELSAHSYVYQLLTSIISFSQFPDSTLLTFCLLTNFSLFILQHFPLSSILELYHRTLNKTLLNNTEKCEYENPTDFTFLDDDIDEYNCSEVLNEEHYSITCNCVEECYKQVNIDSVFRSHDHKQAKKELNQNLQENVASFTEEKLAGSSSQSTAPPRSSSSKYLPPDLEAATPLVGATNDGLTEQHQAADLIGATGYTTNVLPVATASLSQHYGTDFDGDQPLSKEERRKDVRVVPKEKDVDSILESHHKRTSKKTLPSEPQASAKPSAKPRISSNADKRSANADRPPRFPRRACVVHKDEQYKLDAKLLSLPRATKYLVKVRTEISPGRFMAKLVLHCAR